MFMTRKIRSN